MANNNERVVNSHISTKLAELLDAENREWLFGSEETQKVIGEPALSLDITILPRGWEPIVIETEFLPAHGVIGDATSRLNLDLGTGTMLTGNVIAVRIPTDIKTSSQSDLEAKIISSDMFEWCLVSKPASQETGSHIKNEISYNRFPSDGWLSGSLKDLADFIELSIVSEHKLSQAVESFTSHIDSTSAYLEREYEAGHIDLQKVADALFQEPHIQTWKMACAIIGNALLFQTIIASNRPRIVRDPQSLLRNTKGKWRKTLDEWERILEINYWPIFKTAKDVLDKINPTHAEPVIDTLLELCEELHGLDATTTGDLAGQMFGRLIADRKYLATFYTLPSSAHLLAELSVNMVQVNYGSKKELLELRVADFACGTGTLLTAVYHRIATRSRHNKQDAAELHSEMLENVMIGCDIMPAAVHLTATMLSSLLPSKDFDNTRIHLLPFGKNEKAKRGISIGSLEMLDPKANQETLWDSGRRVVSGEGEDAKVSIANDSECDLVVMNPPFTSHTNSDQIDIDKGIFNPAYAAFGTSPDEQKLMAEHEKYLAKKRKNSVGDGNAGLSSYFLDIANAKVKQGGVIGFIVPLTFLNGDSYKKCRALLENHYRDVCLLAISADSPKEQAFSADTGLAELMFIAKKRTESDKEPSNYLYVTLDERPKSSLVAVEIAKKCNELIANPSHQEKSGELFLGEEKFGIWIRSNQLAGGYAGVKSADLTLPASNLYSGKITLPRIGDIVGIPLCSLGELAKIGPGHRDIASSTAEDKATGRSPFTRRKTNNAISANYPMLWNHDNKRETKLIVEPDQEGIPKPSVAKEKIDKIWETRSRFHLTAELSTTSQPLAACMTKLPVIGGRSWPSVSFEDSSWEYCACLWANSTLGLIGYWWIGTRQQLGRSNVSRANQPNLPMIDFRATTFSHDSAKDIFDNFSGKDFLPACQAYHDKTRQELDKALLSELLGLDWNEIEEPLTVLRNKWCSEPTVYGRKSQKPDWLK